MIMEQKKMSENWIFRNHPKEELVYWIGELKYFHFIRAIGGHANDGDCFIASIKYYSKEDLILKLKIVGVELQKISKNESADLRIKKKSRFNTA